MGLCQNRLAALDAAFCLANVGVALFDELGPSICRVVVAQVHQLANALRGIGNALGLHIHLGSEQPGVRGHIAGIRWIDRHRLTVMNNRDGLYRLHLHGLWWRGGWM
ncbi:hypothetical protein D3C84_849860 [compost metagenome]